MIIVACFALAGCNALGSAGRDATAEAIVDDVARDLAATAPSAEVVPEANKSDAEASGETSEGEAQPRRRGGGLFGLFGGGGADRSSRRNRPGISAADFVGEDVAVTPGLASCVTAIGRPDLATNPTADMSNKEIADLLECTSERAKR